MVSPALFFPDRLRPQRQFTGWYSREKALVIAEAVLRERPRICVGVGAVSGRSLVVCAAALQDNGGGTVYGIDARSPGVAIEDAADGSAGEWWLKEDFVQIRQEFYRFVTAMNLTKHVRLIEAPPECAAALFDQIDFLHIDGSHRLDRAGRGCHRVSSQSSKRRFSLCSTMPTGRPPRRRRTLAMLCETVTVMNDPETGRVISVVLRRR